MKRILFAFSLLLILARVGSQNWVNSARFENFNEYFPKLVQETIYEVERRSWSSLHLQDITVNIDEKIYDRTFTGSVLYTNGFLVSIQQMTLTNVMQSFSGTSTVSGSMSAQLNLQDVKIGYDVMANLTNGVHMFTGTYVHGSVQYQIRVTKNMNTDEITSSIQLWNLPAGNLMEYMPANEIGEVLSRHYRASDVWNGMANWGSRVMTPIMQEQIEKIGFPDICFNNC